MSHSLLPRPGRLAARRGFTLAEMLIALGLFSLVGGAILSLVMRQQRFYRSTAEVMKVQTRLRQSASVLPFDLRGISTADTTSNGVAGGKAVNYNADVYARTESSIDSRRTFGSSMLCARPASGATTVTLYPTALDSMRAITTWAAQPAVGDSMLVLDEGRMMGTLDDTWRVYEVKGLSTAKGNKGCPWKTASPVDSTPMLWASDTVRTSYKITISPAISATVNTGAVVRFFRRSKYEIYKAADAQWYLGYSDCLSTYTTTTKCSEPTPVSGPYQSYTGVSTQNGLTFTYYDSAGTALASTDPSRRISRIDVTMRAATPKAVTRTGAGAGSIHRDSLVLSIGIRNPQ